MQRLSSNSTLALKLFFPVFWAVFFGLLILALILADFQGPYFMKTLSFKVTLIVFYTAGLAALYFSMWQLKRVEADDFFVYVTDYFRTARYPFHNIEEIKTAKYPFFNLAVIRLKQRGIFGRKIWFIHKSEAFERVVLNHPELMQRVKTEQD